MLLKFKSKRYLDGLLNNKRIKVKQRTIDTYCEGRLGRQGVEVQSRASWRPEQRSSCGFSYWKKTTKSSLKTRVDLAKE